MYRVLRFRDKGLGFTALGFRGKVGDSCLGFKFSAHRGYLREVIVWPEA